MRSVLVVALVLALGTRARADTPARDAVALLPLDAEQRLEIYGQPVASELARALGAGGIEVVLVGAKMAVPDRARLVIDGTIKAGKGEAVALAVRLRDKSTGTVLDTLDVTAPTLTAIDRAAEQLSALVLPAVKKQLAVAREPRREPVKPVTTAPAPPPAPPAVLVAITGGTQSVLRDALQVAAAPWVAAHHRILTLTDAAHLEPKVAAQSVAGGSAELAIAFEIVGYTTDKSQPPMARARVRVRIADREHVAFDRVIVTDTVVGDRAMTPPALAARVAESILAIVDPRVRRARATW